VQVTPLVLHQWVLGAVARGSAAPDRAADADSVVALAVAITAQHAARATSHVFRRGLTRVLLSSETAALPVLPGVAGLTQ
jgi:hypothetical protein